MLEGGHIVSVCLTTQKTGWPDLPMSLANMSMVNIWLSVCLFWDIQNMEVWWNILLWHIGRLHMIVPSDSNCVVHVIPFYLHKYTSEAMATHTWCNARFFSCVTRPHSALTFKGDNRCRVSLVTLSQSSIIWRQKKAHLNFWFRRL